MCTYSQYTGCSDREGERKGEKERGREGGREGGRVCVHVRERD